MLHVGSGEGRATARIAADILLVDPDEEHCQRCMQALGRAGHRVSTAASGLEALGLVLRVPPDLIISEIDLPTMDGWRLLRLIRERPSIAHMPFIFITAHGDEPVRLRAYRSGVDDVLPKPVATSDFVGRVDRVLSRAQVPRRQTTRNALRGDLSHIALASVLSFIEVEKRTGQMLVVRGDEIATLYIQDGNVIHAELPTQHRLNSLERLLHVLGWKDGQFELTSMEVAAPRTIEISTQFAILEHARRLDECGR
jgi:DNA-binding response OmpR family regulator